MMAWLLDGTRKVESYLVEYTANSMPVVMRQTGIERVSFHTSNVAL
jgi:hypothetical protein